MTTQLPPNLIAMAQCVDAEIARARLEELIADCGDADVLWLSDVVDEAFNQLALATRSQQPPTPRLPAFVREARRRFSFRDS